MILPNLLFNLLLFEKKNHPPSDLMAIHYTFLLSFFFYLCSWAARRVPPRQQQWRF
jgi:hypothetical protein